MSIATQFQARLARYAEISRRSTTKLEAPVTSDWSFGGANFWLTIYLCILGQSCLAQSPYPWPTVESPVFDCTSSPACLKCSETDKRHCIPYQNKQHRSDHLHRLWSIDNTITPTLLRRRGRLRGLISNLKSTLKMIKHGRESCQDISMKITTQ